MPSRKRDPDYWLFIEPYVQVSQSSDAFLFYNSLSGERFEIRSAPGAGRLCKELLKPENGYVVAIGADDLRDKGVAEMVRQLRELFMGELLRREWSAGKPVNIFPEPRFKSNITKETLKKPGARDLIDFDNYIHEAVIYLNSGGPQPPDPFTLAARQFVFPGDTLEGPAEMPYEQLETLLREVSRFKVSMVQVSGTDIHQYGRIEALAELLAETAVPVTYNIRLEKYNPAMAGALMKNRAARLSVHFTFPMNGEDFNALLTDLPERTDLKRVDFHFVVSSQEELATAREIIAATGLPNTYLSPFYNGLNFGFFRDTVFITKDDILSSTPSQNQVFSRVSVNESDFGKFTLLPDGAIYANLNDPPVGKLGSHNLEELILTELMTGVSWTRTRISVSPCGRCLYNFLCPPVSSYELIMKRFNFCDVFE
jgi:pseudo-rSAM protein